MQDTKNNKNTSLLNKQSTKVKVVDSESQSEPVTIFHRVENYLNSNYKLRFNSISLDIEMSELNLTNWQCCNDNSLWIELQKKELKVGQNALKALLKSDFVPKYNPLEEYFKNLPKWDRTTDYIRKYADYVELDVKEDYNQFVYHFKKWCVRVVKCALNENYFNKQAFVLADDGNGQNIGKSTWCRNLCPKTLSKYIAEDMDSNSKDARVLLCKNLLINLDELAVLSKKEINQLKSLFSKDQINERLPYDSKNSILPRVASFIGSTNKTTFLDDETGSVRWLCFVVKNIDWNYLRDFNTDFLWSQAYHLSKDKTYVAELNREDIDKNEERNEKFQILSSEREQLHKYFEHSNSSDGEFKTATDISDHINLYSTIRVNRVQLGKALKASNYERIKQDGVYGYYVKTKPIN